MDRNEEILTILQEECAEVIQAISKVRRFGMDNNLKDLQQEISDVEYMIKLAKLNIEGFDQFEWSKAENRKYEKLQKYSNIFSTQ